MKEKKRKEKKNLGRVRRGRGGGGTGRERKGRDRRGPRGKPTLYTDHRKKEAVWRACTDLMNPYNPNSEGFVPGGRVGGGARVC